MPSAVSIADWWAPWIGRPFDAEHFNCWTLVREVYSQLMGIELPTYGEISARDLMRVARQMERKKDEGWSIPAWPRAGDVAIMRSGRGGRALVIHVGVMVDERRILHVEEASAAAVVSVSHYSVAGRLVGIRRHELARSLS